MLTSPETQRTLHSPQWPVRQAEGRAIPAASASSSSDSLPLALSDFLESANSTVPPLPETPAMTSKDS
jgi:hypothetical protein